MLQKPSFIIQPANSGRYLVVLVDRKCLKGIRLTTRYISHNATIANLESYSQFVIFVGICKGSRLQHYFYKKE